MSAKVSPNFKLPLSDEEIERLFTAERSPVPAAPVQIIRRPEDEDGGVAQLVVIQDSDRMMQMRQRQ